MRMLEQNEAYVDPDLPRVIIPYASLHYMWQGRRSAGFSTLQYCRLTGRQGPLPLCDAARKG